MAQIKQMPIWFDFLHLTRHLRIKLSTGIESSNMAGIPMKLPTSKLAPLSVRFRTTQSITDLPSIMILPAFNVRCRVSFRRSSIGHSQRKRSAWILSVTTKHTRAAALFFGGHNRFNAAFFTNENHPVLFGTGYQRAGFFDHLSRTPSAIRRLKDIVCHR